MSYDIRLGVRVYGTEDLFVIIAKPDEPSPTYNIGKMLRKCTGWDFKQSEWYKVADVFPLIDNGIKELLFNEEEYKKYDSPNGWGTTRTALRALKSMKKCIGEIVTGDWGWDQIPVEHLWIRW